MPTDQEKALASRNELISRMIQTTDIASNILNAISVVEDKSNADKYDQIIKDAVTETLQTAQALATMAKKDGYNIIADAIKQLPNTLISMQSFNKDIAYAGKRGLNMTASMMSIRNKYYAQSHFADLFTSIVFDMPQSYILDQCKEWYNSAFTPADPSEALIIEQYTRGNMTAEQASYFLGIRGVPANYAMWIYDSYEKYPTVRELAVASQFMEITDAQMLNYMKYSGITLQANKDFYLNYMHGIQLRTELNAYLTQLKADYNAGIMTQAEFTAEIVAHKPNAKEQAQIILNANHQRTRTLLNMEITARTWFYRKGNYGEPATDGEAELQFYYALIEANMDALFANGLVRLEASKLGYPWEYEP